MRILVVYPGHSYSTIDVAHGYEKALRKLGHEVRAYNYHKTLDFYIGALAHWEERNPDFERTDGDFLILASEHLAIAAVDFVPDVVLVICGIALHRRGYELMHRLALPTIIIFTESPYNDAVQTVIAQRAPGIAGVLVNDKTSLSMGRWLYDCGVEVEYLPHSFDPERHKPRPELSKETDVFFFGTLFSERQILFSALQEAANGHNLAIDGIDPTENYAMKPFPAMDNGDVARNYAQTKIALNQHRTTIDVHNDDTGHIRTAYSIGPRAYEIAACGAFQLSDDTRPELRVVFGDSVATYQGNQDLIDKVEYFLKHDDERNEMALQALERVQPCTFEARARDILIPFIEEVT